MAFEYFEGDSLLHRLDPRVKIVLYLTFTLFAIVYSDPIVLGVVYLLALGTIKAAGIPLRKMAPALKAILPFLVVYPLFNIFGYRGGFGMQYSLGRFLFWNIYLEALVYSIGVELKVLIIVTVLNVVLYVTPISRLVGSLAKWRMPADFIVALSIGFSYVPVLMNEVRETLNAQEARGFSHRSRNPVRLLLNYIPVIMPSFMSAFRRAQDIALSIETRGFGYSLGKRTSITQTKFGRDDWPVMATLLAAIGVALVTGQWGLDLGDFRFSLNFFRILLRM